MRRRIRNLSIVVLFRGVPRSRLAAMILLGFLGGAAEAVLLVLIVRVATLAMGGETARSALGALDVLPSSLGAMIVTGVLAGVLTIAFQVSGVFVTARAASVRMVRTRKAVLSRYFGGSLGTHGSATPGRLQEVFSQQILKGTEGLVLAGSTAAAMSNLLVLLVTSLVIAPLAAVALVVLGGVLGLALVPLSRAVAVSSRRMVDGAMDLMGFVAVFVRLPLELRVFGVGTAVEELAAVKIEGVARAWRRTRVVQQSSPIVFRVTVLLVAFGVIGAVAMLVPSAITQVALIALLLVRSLSYLQAIQTNSQQMREMSVNWSTAAAQIDSFEPDEVRWGNAPLREISSIEFDEVGYSYDGESRQLDGVSMTLRRGDLVTLVGPSGAGKSTFLRLLLRLAEPTGGELIVNGRSAADHRVEDWFSRVAYLPQEVRLIPGTLRDNVLFHRIADDDDVRRAIEVAALELDPRIFPQGLDSHVVDEGKNLSGGQRQRIGLARCLLTRPDLLVLDEPTSALDPETERQVIDTIRSWKDRLITVVVTHRPAAEDHADRVYSVVSGRLRLRSAALGVETSS